MVSNLLDLQIMMQGCNACLMQCDTRIEIKSILAFEHCINSDGSRGVVSLPLTMLQKVEKATALPDDRNFVPEGTLV